MSDDIYTRHAQVYASLWMLMDAIKYGDLVAVSPDASARVALTLKSALDYLSGSDMRSAIEEAAAKIQKRAEGAA